MLYSLSSSSDVQSALSVISRFSGIPGHVQNFWAKYLFIQSLFATEEAKDLYYVPFCW